MANSKKKSIVCAALICAAFFIAVCAVVSVLLNGSLGGSDKTSKKQYENAVYIYMCGSTLETKSASATKNIEAILSAKLPQNSTVIIETGGARKWRSNDIPSDAIVRYEVKNGQLVELERCENESMGNAQTLSSFINFCNENYSANNTTLLFWNHGAGSVEGVCLDENYSMDGLSASEINEAFEQTNSHFTNVCFDACLMANFETMRVVSNHADTMIASQEIEPAAGWDYSTIIESIGSTNFANDVLSSYENVCKASGKSLYTLSAVDMSRFSQVEAAVDVFCSDVLCSKAEDGQLQDVSQAAKNAMAFGQSEAKSNFVDLGQFSQNLGVSFVEQAIESCCLTVNGSDRAGACGISIFFPLSGTIELKKYLASETNYEYSLFLGRYFDKKIASKSAIVFENEGSIDGTTLNFKVSNSTAVNVQGVVYDIYQLKDGATANCLGFDNDIHKTDNGEYSISFSGQWVALNGNILCCEPIDTVGDITVFTSPVKLNAVEGDLRFTFNAKTRSFSLQGFVPLEDEQAQGRLESVNPGDEITILNERFVSAGNSETEYTDAATITVDDTLTLHTATLPDGSYQIYGIATDLYGNDYITRSFIVSLEGGAVAAARMK